MAYSKTKGGRIPASEPNSYKCSDIDCTNTVDPLPVPTCVCGNTVNGCYATIDVDCQSDLNYC